MPLGVGNVEEGRGGVGHETEALLGFPSRVLDARAFERVAEHAVQQRAGDLSLHQVVAGAGAERLGVYRPIGGSGEKNEGPAQALLARPAEQIEAVVGAEVVVHQHDVVTAAGQRRERVGKRARPLQPVAAMPAVGEQVAGDEVVFLVVLDQEDAKRPGVHARREAGGSSAISSQ